MHDSLCAAIVSWPYYDVDVLVWPTTLAFEGDQWLMSLVGLAFADIPAQLRMPVSWLYHAGLALAEALGPGYEHGTVRRFTGLLGSELRTQHAAYARGFTDAIGANPASAMIRQVLSWDGAARGLRYAVASVPVNEAHAWQLNGVPLCYTDRPVRLGIADDTVRDVQVFIDADEFLWPLDELTGAGNELAAVRARADRPQIQRRALSVEYNLDLNQ
jgi:hypothetical protein